jgi:hypothetical protein
LTVFLVENIYVLVYIFYIVRIPAGEYHNGRQVYKNLMIDDLRQKLQGVKNVTHALGTTKIVRENSASAFRRELARFMDSSNNVESGACTFPDPLS